MNPAQNTTSTTINRRGPDAVTEAVVNAVADIDGTSPLELRPLSTVIDPDALGKLVRNGEDVSVEFAYCGYNVCVSSIGKVTVRD
ncbi:HalOD1 output domain-containing protein [Natrinema halophilum]|uniref:HalOD1 output domain-containing protein n=1 Tax=Natrinema halophilum TaxID=1699371 RepID=UPI001F3780D8|nr:HalOD1 output domain-containing protein [Natrinema halophilum]QLG47927.2 hypothetical protein HYG82_03240 [Natrinema halophilum]